MISRVRQSLARISADVALEEALRSCVPLSFPVTAVLFSFHLESLCLWLSRNIFECEVISVVDGMADASGSYDPESVFIAGEERIRTQPGRILNHPEPTVGE